MILENIKPKAETLHDAFGISQERWAEITINFETKYDALPTETKKTKVLEAVLESVETEREFIALMTGVFI